MKKKPKKRKAWLITWESSRRDYLENLNRPIVVAVLKPQLSDDTIKRILPVLFASESKLTFAEKIGHGLMKQPPGWISRYCQSHFCGNNPWLHARKVKDLHLIRHEDSDYHQTLCWTEVEKYNFDDTRSKVVKVLGETEGSVETRFDQVWWGEKREP